MNSSDTRVHQNVSHSYGYSPEFHRVSFIDSLSRTGHTVYETSIRMSQGQLRNDEVFTRLSRLCSDHKLAVLAHHSSPVNCDLVLSSSDRFCSLHLRPTGGNVLSSYFVTPDREEHEALLAFIQATEEKSAASDNAWVIVATSQGITARGLPPARYQVTFSPESYSHTIHDQIETMVTELTTPNPLGRITILEGTTGTGKTFLIRSLFKRCPGIPFIFVSPETLPELADPSSVSILLEVYRKGFPIVLVCEDAEWLLTKRDTSNMKVLSAVLNLTAGIIGELCDVRMVITTNVDRSKFDDAVLRPGRLSQIIKVPPLSLEEANSFFARLTEKSPPEWGKLVVDRKPQVGFSAEGDPSKGVPLALVYREASKQGWKPKTDLGVVEEAKWFDRFVAAQFARLESP